MVTVLGSSGPMSVGTPFQQAGGGRTISTAGKITRGGGGTVSQISENLQSTREGIVDIRTGKVIAPVGTSVTEAARLAEQSFQAQQAAEAASRRTKIQEQLRAKEQLKIKEQARVDLAAKTETVRQEKAFSGTIAGQLEGKPSQIGLPGTFVERAEAIGTGVPSPDPKFDIELVRKVGREFFFVEGTPIKAVGTLVSPLQRFFPKLVEEAEFIAPRFGTVSTEPLPFGAGGGEVTTLEKVARAEVVVDPSLLIPTGARVTKVSEQISKELVSELQPEVTAQRLTVEEAEKQFETKFEERFEERIPDIERGARFRERLVAGKEPLFKVEAPAELAAIGVASITPTGAALVGASFVAEGLPKITGGETLTQRGLGVAQVGLGFVGGGLAVRGAERAADIALVRELQLERGKTIGREIAKTEEGALFDIKTVRQFGAEARLETRIKAPVFRTGEGQFAITGGRGKAELEFFSVAKGKPIKTAEEFTFGGRQFVSPQAPKIVSKDFSVGLEEFQGTFGKGFVQKRGEETFREFGFGGISRDVETQVGKVTQFQAGAQRGLRLESIERLKRGGIVFKEAKGKFAIEEAGLIKRLPPAPEDTGVRFIQPAKIKKTPFQVTFQELKIPAPTGVTTQIERQLFEPAQIVKPSRELVGIPRSVGGEGLTELQLAQARGGLAQQELIQPLVKPPTTRGAFIQPRLTGVGAREDFVQLGLVQPRVEPAVRERLVTLPRIAPSLKTFVGVREIPRERVELGTGMATLQEARLETRLVQETLLQPPITPRVPFRPIEAFDFGLPFIFPPFLGPVGKRGKRKKRARPRVPIRPSFTGIVLEIEEAPIISPTLGVVPGQIRGLATGFEVPKKRKKKKSKKKKK